MASMRAIAVGETTGCRRYTCRAMGSLTNSERRRSAASIVHVRRLLRRARGFETSESRPSVTSSSRSSLSWT
jgi:hypothetical protein